MKNAISWNSRISIFGIPLLLVLSMIVLVKTSIFQLYSQQLAIGVTLDLLLTVPIVYLLLIWKSDIPKYTVVSVFVICLLIASYILPIDTQFLLSPIKTFVFPIIEILVISTLLFKLHKTRKQYKIQKSVSADFYTALTAASKEVLPKRIAAILATEMGVIYYTFFNWRKSPLKENEFSYYKKSGIKLVLYVFICLAIMETIVVHLLVHSWHASLAWVLTFLSLYTCLQIIGLIRSMDKRPISVDTTNRILVLKYGFFSETIISLDHIEKIELSSRTPKDDNIIPFSPLGPLDTHNTIIYLEQSNILQGLYGIEKSYTGILVYTDEKLAFKDLLDNQIVANE